MLVLDDRRKTFHFITNSFEHLSLEANFLDKLSIILPWFWNKSIKGEKLLEELLP
jgi:hypothetical protein